jgi:hypothetical protein
VSIAGTGGDEASRSPDPSEHPRPATVRPGPAQLPADSWDSPPATEPGGWSLGPWIPAGPEAAAGDADGPAYQGHRRADPPRRPRLLIVGLVLLALAAIVIVPLVWSSSGEDHPAAVAPAATSGTVAGTSGRSGGDVSLAPATGALGATSAPATSTAGVVVPRPPNPTVPRTTTTLPIMAPMTFEAEGPNVTIAGSAFVSAYPGASNGSIVRNLGRWDDNPGTLRFNSVVIPTAGTYVLTFYAVHIDGEPTRSAQITVSGANPVTATFNASATCCTPTRVTMVLAAGTHTVMVANASGHAPSLDKMVVGRG